MNDDNKKIEDQKAEDQAPAVTDEKMQELEAPDEAQLPAPHDMQIEETEKDGKTEPEQPDGKTLKEANLAKETPEQTVEQPARNTSQSDAGGEPEDKIKEQESQALEEPVEGEPKASDLAKWYIVHTYSGHENKVAKSLHQRVESMGFEDRIFDIIVPTRDTIKVSQGKKENVKEKIFPGYVLVKMILDDESWLLVRTTQGVTAFIGAGNKPTPISDKEVKAIKKFMEAEEPLFTTTFTIGEAVKIVDGPFSDFLGTVDNIDDARGKIKVLVSIFGRETPVELDFLQVTKL